MPVAQRQSSLFVAEDWRVIYRAFTEVNFSAYDFDTIRDSMIDYIRRNFPEDFNDWIESSEFVALIELLAYLGQSLAFRTDMNMRENFLDTAEKRESILKLARFISYSPSRNIAAEGILKITQVSTNHNVFDSNGINLANRTVRWNDPNNPDWYEQFILILNDIFNKNNPFGRPLKTGIVDGVNTQLYALNNVANTNNVYSFSSQINDRILSFEVVNIDFNNQGVFEERHPDPLEAFHLVYQNDGNGNSSEHTGFFFMFKQGTLVNQDFTINTPIENRVINVDGTNINNSDVYVQEIDQNGFIINKWVDVPSLVGNNIIFNSIDRNERNIYQVITKESDKIAIRFADGRFGTVPNGFFRVWTRQSANERYVIKTDEMSNVSISIPYNGDDNSIYNSSFTLTLQNSVSNSAPTESNSDIKRNAPQVYYTQDRMVNGEDYNVFPLQNSEVANIKAVNRIHSGFSRYIDINDPTGISQNVNLFGEDGIFYHVIDNELEELSLPTTLDNSSIVTSVILPISNKQARKHFYYFNYPRYETSNPSSQTVVFDNTSIYWIPSVSSINSSTGYFSNVIGGVTPILIGDNSNEDPIPSGEFFINEGALLKFNKAGWVSVVSVINNGLGTNGNGILDNGTGAVTLSENVDGDDYIEMVIANFRTTFSEIEQTQIETQISFNNNFGLRYDTNTLTWEVVSGADINVTNEFSLSNQGSTTALNEDSSWLIRAEYSQSAWRFYARTMDYVFESTNQIRFYFDKSRTIKDANTGQVVTDFVNILKVNPHINPASETDINDNPVPDSFEEDNICHGLGNDQLMYVEDVFRADDGFVSNRRIKLTFSDTDQDGVPDDPDVFSNVTGIDNQSITHPLVDVIVDKSEVFFETYVNNDGFQEIRPINSIIAAFNDEIIPLTKAEVEARILNATNEEYTVVDGDIIYIRESESFLIYDEIEDSFELTDNIYLYYRGRGDLYFQWKHFAPTTNRIDPAITNIVDVYVLTVGYDTDIRLWIDNNGDMETKPIPPTTESLKSMFKDIETKKMLSDQIIWHPAKYKLLFGAQADEELRASFKVTKVPGTEIPDGEIKSRIIDAINEFFAIGNFDFGETFYFTELSSFIHHRLATIIGSVVIVPLNNESHFGDLFQVRSNPDEIFISSAKVSDIQIVDSFNDNILRIGN